MTVGAVRAGRLGRCGVRSGAHTESRARCFGAGSANGNVANGNVADGHVADGHVADGNVADGNVADGNAADENLADGNAARCRDAAGQPSDAICRNAAAAAPLPRPAPPRACRMRTARNGLVHQAHRRTPRPGSPSPPHAA